jgi:hypothetical protein
MTDTPIQIRNPDVVRDIHTLSERLGLPIADVVADAVRRRLAEESVRIEDRLHDRRRRIEQVLERIDALPKRGALIADNDLYDDDGFPIGAEK